MLTVEGFCVTELSTYSSNHVLHSLKVRKCLGYESNLFFQYVDSLMQILKMERKVDKMLLVF